MNSLDAIYRAVGDFARLVFPDLLVIQAGTNDVPMPGKPFMSMQVIGTYRLGWTRTSGKDNDTSIAVQPQRVVVQLDFLNVDLSETVRFRTLFESAYGYENMHPPVKPLYCGDFKQMFIVNSEKGWEYRFTGECHLQMNQKEEYAQPHMTAPAEPLTGPGIWPADVVF